MAAQPKFTEGPWTLFEDPVRRVIRGGSKTKQRTVCIIEDWTTEPDARLISAAPDLYAALKVFLEARATGGANHLKLAETAARSAMLKADGDE